MALRKVQAEEIHSEEAVNVTRLPRSAVDPLALPSQPPTTIGGLLRQAREKFGQEISVVASELCIREHYLRAIEEGRMQDLPATTYALGFVRSYAEYLGLNPTEAVNRFRTEVANEEKVKPSFAVPLERQRREHRLPKGGIFFSLLGLLVLGAAGYYFFLSDGGRSLGGLDTAGIVSLLNQQIGTPESGSPVEQTPSTEAAATGNTGNQSPAALPVPPAVEPATGPSAIDEILAGEETLPPEGAEASPAPSLEPALPPLLVLANDGRPIYEALSDVARKPQLPAANPPGDGSEAVPQQQAASGDTAAPTASSSEPEVTLATLPYIADRMPPERSQFSFAATPLSLGPTNSNSNNRPSQPAAAEQPQPGVASAGGESSPPSTVVLVARMESWVQIKDPQGKIVASKLLAEGERLDVPELPGLVMDTGNAGGLEVQVRGQIVPPLGSRGVPRRNISLDPALLTGAAPAP